MPDEKLPIDNSPLLSDLLARKAREWSLNKDVPTIVAGLREKRQLWNAAQARGTRTLIQDKNIKVGGPKLVLGKKSNKKPASSAPDSPPESPTEAVKLVLGKLKF